MVSIAELQILLSGKDNASAALKSADSSAGNLGKTLAGVALGTAALAVGAGAALFKVGKDFDKAFDTISVGTGATGKTLEGLQDSFKTVFTSVPTDMEKASMAIADLNTRTGATGPVLEDMAKQMLEMTRLTGGDLSTNIAAVTRVMGDWGVSAEDSSLLMDKLFLVSQSTGVGIDTLASQMVQFGAPLRQLGFGLETSAALLGKFEKEGVNAELVMGSLRIALGKMAREGEPAEETLARTVDAIKNAGSVSEANALALELFGARAGPDMAAAIREGRFAVDDLVAMMGDAGGAIEDNAARTADFGEKWTLLKNRVLLAIQPMATKVFEFAGKFLDFFSVKMLPVLASFGEKFAEVGGFVKTALEGPLETARALFDDKLLPAMERFRAFAEEKLLPPLQRFADWFKNNESAMQAAGVAIGAVLVTAFAALAISAGAAAVAMVAAALPILAIVAVVAAVAAGVFLLVKHWDDLSERFPILQEGLDALIEYFERLKAFAVDQLVPALVRIGEAAMAAARFVKDNWGTIAAILKPIIDQVKAYIELIVEVFSSVVAAVVAIINGDWTQAWEEVKDILRAFKDFFAETLDNLVELMKEIGPLLLEAGKLAMEKLWEGVQWIWNSVVKPGFAAMPGLIVAGLGALGSLLLEKGKDILRGLWDGITNIWGQQVVPFFQNLPGRIVGAIGSLAGVLFAKGVEIIQGLIDGIKSMAGKVADAVADAIPGVPSLTGGGGGTFQGGQFGPEARAIGGPVTAGYPYIVGEKGAELFVPETNGRIVPNGEFGGEGEGGGIHFHGPVTIMARDRADAERSMRDIQFALRARGA